MIVDPLIRSGYAELHDGRLYFETAGSGEYAIIFIHGMGLDHRMWDDQFEPFSRQYTAIRYDVRGYGKSTMPEKEPYSHQNDLKWLLDRIGIIQAALVGISMGGGIALDFALDYPECVSSLILSNSALNGYRPSAASGDLNAVYEHIEAAAAELQFESKKR
ncbi:alpha/beta fold hydrolase [Paenibacillus allorhizosphaerae]|uniref:GOLD domain-containing protein n=1 Tax=Paenibacillus allorhizosphaerae TaxID=2849866 RepID=A0ABM8VHL1_9BACL|nr:alpha/beta fold hydrolase [Paenibacillus allorhizosphaerae]CAG7642380.1 hypothetical protein PAECIP111802_02851 [Paenibacillus allorhizosphaerae]